MPEASISARLEGEYAVLRPGIRVMHGVDLPGPAGPLVVQTVSMRDLGWVRMETVLGWVVRRGIGRPCGHSLHHRFSRRIVTG